MSQIVKQLRDNRKVIFDKGRFDDWCVYVVEQNGTKRAPRDQEYFAELKNISKHYPNDKVYNDFVAIYDQTNKNIDKDVRTLIDELVSTYKKQHQGAIEQWFSVLYAGMIAEENKKYAILKKRIKRLGMHQILKSDYSPEKAANYSRGKKWPELDKIMTSLGF